MSSLVEVKQKVLGIVLEVTKQNPEKVDDNTPFEKYDEIDGLDEAEILAKIEEVFGIDIPDVNLMGGPGQQVRNVSELAVIIIDKMEKKAAV